MKSVYIKIRRTHGYEVPRILALSSMVVVGNGLILGLPRRMVSFLGGVLDHDGSVDAIRRQVHRWGDGRWSRFLAGTKEVTQGASASARASSSTHLRWYSGGSG